MFYEGQKASFILDYKTHFANPGQNVHYVTM